MSGNEFGERIHNFFGQEGLSRYQHQSQVVDGSFSNFSNNLVGNQRQINPSLIANLKSYSTQQSVDPVSWQSSDSQHGNFTQQPVRSDYSRSLLQENQQSTNGYMHGNLAMQGSRNEANVFGVDTEPSRDKLSESGFTPDLRKNPMRLEMGESPVNYDFFAGQQQLNSQLPGMLQPFPRQQMTFNDMQLLKQQAMVKQMHEYQMQQQLQKQQLGARQLNSLHSNAIGGNHTSDNQSHPLISGVPHQDASTVCWQPDLMTGNTNSTHRGISPVIQGSSTGQANLLAQQFQPSLYGMPIGGANAPEHAFSSVQMNRLTAQHGSANIHSSLTNQPTLFLNQSDLQNSHKPDFEIFKQDNSHEKNILVPEKFGQMEGLSENSCVKVPENINTLQKSTELDPTEQKILFGSDDNLWDAFGNSTDTSFTGNLMSGSSDLPCPSLQSGSWSALMLSAVAETSSDGAGVHEWGSKQQLVWANNNTGPRADSHTGNTASNALNERVSTDLTRTAVQHLEDKGNKVSDYGLLEKPMVQHSQMAGNMFHSSSSSIDKQDKPCFIQKNEGTVDRLGIWKAASPSFVDPMQRASYGAGNDSGTHTDDQGNIQQNLDNKSVEKAIPQQKFRDSGQILESYVCTNASNVMAESNEMRKGSSSSSFRSKYSPESSTCGFREITQVNACDASMLPVGKETQSPSRSEGLVRDGINHKESINHMLPFGQAVPQSFANKNHAALAGTGPQQICSQITPSSYSQYVAFKNGLVQPVNDTVRFTPSKIEEQYSNVENLVDGLHSVKPLEQLNTVDPSSVRIQQMPGSALGAEIPSSDSLPQGATDRLLKVDKPKKRKTATSELLSWNEEVMQGPHRLKTLGEAEVDWSRATIRLAENVEFEILLEDGPLMRSKRRLIYATKLMQQLFCPPPARVISLVANSNYEFIVYTAARAALGDACSSSNSTDRSERLSPSKNLRPLSERMKTETISDQYISKAAEDFINRTKKLENDFARLENGATISDLIIEVQDLERFAVINRFASFHQSSSSADRTSSSHRSNPQRYVTIAPMPRNIPDRVQCLSF